MKFRPPFTILPAACAGLACCLVLFLNGVWQWGIVLLALVLVCTAAGIYMLVRYESESARRMDSIFTDNSNAISALVEELKLPCLLVDDEGRIPWRNDAFKLISDASDISKLLPEYDAASPIPAISAEVHGRRYQILTSRVKRSDGQARPLSFQYWIDRTAEAHYSRLFEEKMPTVALIYIDNYDDLVRDKQFMSTNALLDAERRIARFSADMGGIYQRYDQSKFLVVFEGKHLGELEKQRFTLLDTIREVNTGTGQPMTLSIAIGAEPDMVSCAASARQAMELVLARGGDQAAVKRGSSYAFYGGRAQTASNRASRVKTRMFAKALRQLMENSSDVYIVGHRYPDMDCVGAALGLMRCAEAVKCSAHFVLGEANSTIESAVELMNRNPLYKERMVTPEAALSGLKAGAVLIVVDTQREVSVMAPELLKAAPKLVLIDHHRRSVDSIAGATLTYLEPAASSISEIITEVIQYFDENLKPTGFECDSMLAGITIDTKNFAVNTGARTFEAAAYLRKNGADSAVVRTLFQDDREAFIQRARVVEAAEMVGDSVAVAVCPPDVSDSSLIAPQAADTLIQIRGIQASFVLARFGDYVSVSARSLGSMNVQLICEKIGGGGHLTSAGAQLRGMSMEEAKQSVEDAVKEYLKEVDEV